MNFQTRQLRLFEATARLGSLSRAAEEQAITQSAASQSLKELEKQLGYRLLQKLGRGLRLTEQGREILPRVRRLLMDLDSLQYPAEGFVGGELRLTASVTIASYLLPPILAGFLRQHPRVSPKVDIQNTRTVMEQIRLGRSSVGFVEGPVTQSDLLVTPWHADQLAVFCAPEHPVLRGGLPTMETLMKESWILREPGSGTREIFDRALDTLGYQPRIALELSRQEAIKQSVRAGLGIGCLSELSIRDEVRAGRLCRLPFAADLSRSFSLVRLQPESETPLIRSFVGHATRFVEEIGKEDQAS